MPSEDAQEVAEILDAVAGRVPALLRSMLDLLYSQEAGSRMGKAIGSFYQELTAAGLPPDRALQLAEDYASPLGIVRTLLGEGGGAAGQGFSWSWSGHAPRPKPAAPGTGKAEPAALEDCFNNVGTSDDGAEAAADLDGVGWSLSAQALAAAGVVPGGTLTVDGLTFLWPEVPVGRPNNVQADGQCVQLTARPGATRLGFLGLATHGPSAGLATLQYADGRTQTVALSFPDWTLGDGGGELPVGTHVGVRMPRRNGDKGEQTELETMLFVTSLPLRPGQPPVSIALPRQLDQGALHIFAIALGD